MRLLVACPRCRRQYDATGRPAGARYRCSCSGIVVVPEPVAHDAAVVRCSSCGAPRLEGEPACRFCGCDFTLRERDLDTLCPGCMARVSGRARFCHHCAIPILRIQAAGSPTGHACPACGGDRLLASRRLGSEQVAVFECEVCAGLWVDREVFEALAGRAREGKLPDLGQAGVMAGGPVEAAAPASGRVYRPCVSCGALMHRKNYGRKSGVIVDVCRDHGVWFDQDELARLLGWIRAGGEDQAQALAAAEARAEERQKKLFPAASWPDEEEKNGWFSGASGSLLGDLLASALGRILPRLFS